MRLPNLSTPLDIARDFYDPNLPLPPRPTNAKPGTRQKLEVMAWRAANGYRIFHPDDWPRKRELA